MSHCHCGEFDRPTIAPNEFGETCFHERDKCEVYVPDSVPIETVLRLTRARAEKAEAAIQRVRELESRWRVHTAFITSGAEAAYALRRALDGDA